VLAAVVAVALWVRRAGGGTTAASPATPARCSTRTTPPLPGSAMGYGRPGSGLVLDLVYNPVGASLLIVLVSAGLAYANGANDVPLRRPGAVRPRRLRFERRAASPRSRSWRICRPPRAVAAPFALGYPLGKPDAPELQRRVLRALLSLCASTDVLQSRRWMCDGGSHE